MATKLNLGTNIWADESTLPVATGAFADQYITGGSEGLMNRLINDSDNKLVLIEVQTGSYFGEDDIVRLEDDYNTE